MAGLGRISVDTNVSTGEGSGVRNRTPGVSRAVGELPAPRSPAPCIAYYVRIRRDSLPHATARVTMPDPHSRVRPVARPRHSPGEPLDVPRSAGIPRERVPSECPLPLVVDEDAILLPVTDLAVAHGGVPTHPDTRPNPCSRRSRTVRWFPAPARGRRRQTASRHGSRSPAPPGSHPS